MIKKRLLRFARNDTVLLFVFILILGVFSYVFVEAKQKVSIGTKEVEGQISTIGKGYISIIYKKDAVTGTEYEMLLPYDGAALTMERKDSLQELQAGDTIKIQYEELSDMDIKEPRTENKVKKITFVRPAPPKPVVADTDEE